MSFQLQIDKLNTYGIDSDAQARQLGSGQPALATTVTAEQDPFVVDSPEARKIRGLLNLPEQQSTLWAAGTTMPPNMGPSSLDPCNKYKNAMIFHGVAGSAILGGSGYVWFEHGTQLDPWRSKLLLGVLLLGTPLVELTNVIYFKENLNLYNSRCRGPSDPQDPLPTAPEHENNPQPVHPPGKETSWEEEGEPKLELAWGLVGGVAALAAVALALFPLDGPAGEAALGAASLAAFTKAGL